MDFKLYIDGVERSDCLLVDSVSISDQLNNRNTMGFVLVDTDDSCSDIVVGAEVVFKNASNESLFGGSVSYIDYKVETGTSAVLYRVECVDYNELCDRRLVAEVYEDMTAGDIVRDIVANFLDGEGVTTNNVEDGPVIEFALFNYNTVNSALNDLSSQTGYSWYIDYDKDLHFFARETNLAPFSVTASSGNWRNMTVKKTKEKYRNVQYIRGGRELSDSRTEEFVGDGARRTFTVSLPIATVPTVEVNGVAQTVGIRGLETGRQWYWNKESNEVSQEDTAPVLTSSDTLEVTYRGFFPILVLAQEQTGVLARQAIEGGSGKYVAIDNDPKIETSAQAISKANGLLRRYGEVPEIVTFETDTAGLRAGQLITINVPEYGLNDQYQIDNVSVSEVQGQLLRYRVVALSGESFGGWIEFFKKLTENKQDYVIRENEVLIRVLTFSEYIKAADVFSYDTTVDNRVGYAVVGFSEAV